MTKNIRLQELILFLGECSGDEAIDLVHAFQSGALTIENIGVSDDDFADEIIEV